MELCAKYNRMAILTLMPANIELSTLMELEDTFDDWRWKIVKELNREKNDFMV